MSFPTPSASQPETETASQPETETEPETELIFGDVNEEYEDYWAVVDTYRFLSKLARSHLFSADERADGVTNADIAALVDKSPIAEHFVFYKDAKNQIKTDLGERRGDDIPERASLPAYKDERETPAFDCQEVTEDNLAEFGLAEDTWTDRDEQICLSAEYEPVVDDDGNLVVWFEDKAKDFDLAEVLAIAEDTDGIGKKTLDALKANLEDAL